MPTYFALLLIISTVFITGFGKASSSVSNSPGSSSSQPSLNTAETVWISRQDGAKYCEPNSGKSLAQDEDELKNAGVSPIESRKGNDGKAHIQECGTAKGSTNEFLIASGDLEKAISLEYQAITP